ncbi:MAG TPA: chloride channel protein [Dongiaceae bacterium]|nr:chloride channel protein [Dongiaceae bacterium]
MPRPLPDDPEQRRAPEPGAARQKAKLGWRRTRTALLSPILWRRRAVFIIGAAAVGLAAVVFAKASDEAQVLFRAVAGRWPFLPLVVTPVGFALVAWMTRAWFDGAQGSGIPQAIAARRSVDSEHRSALMSARVTIGKIVLTVLGLLVGASTGREGPTVQVGAAVMFGIGRFAGIGRQPGLILAGAAAGVAGAFNTPLAGIVFAIEEMAKAFDRRMNVLVIAAVVLAGLTSLSLIGDYNYFGQVSTSLGSVDDWLAVVLCGVFCGGLGGLFSRGVVTVAAARDGWLALLKRRPMIFAGICGLIVASLGLVTDGFATGTGYGPTRHALEAGMLQPLWYGPAKLVSTLLSSVSGIPGGLFSPSLAVGAAFASLVHLALPAANLQALSLLAMVAYFAGVVQSPLTAFVIVLEMTSDKGMAMPLMAAALLAAGTSRLIAPEPLYHALSYNYDAARS